MRMGPPVRWWPRPALPDALVISGAIIAAATILSLLGGGRP